MSTSPFFGITLSLFTFYIGIILQEKTKKNYLNPLPVSIVLTIAILQLLKVSYGDYMVGGSFIQMMIPPASVVLVVPLYRNWDIFLANKREVLLGSLVGSLTAVLSILLLSHLFGLDRQTVVSLLPKSITSAIGLPLSEEYGGVQSITAFAIAVTGITGLILSEPIFKLLGITDPVTRGCALGTSAHAIGTTKAQEYGDISAAISGLSLFLAGIFTVVLLGLYFAYF
ncbi:MAG: LrgB family protein [Tissierellia bacterium]|nr:LrgB family protein [Tissierellia bacterium]